MTPEPGSQRSLGPRDLLDVLLAQYTSVRSEGTQSLAAQLSALSLGIAAIAVLVTGVGTIWQRSPLIASVGLMTMVPGVSYFVLLVWATEIKKTLRASSFLRLFAEPHINALFRGREPLAWERDGYKYGNIASYYWTILLSLASFAAISFSVGVFKFERLASHRHGWLWSDWWPIAFGVLVAAPLPAIVHHVCHETRLNFGERGA